MKTLVIIDFMYLMHKHLYYVKQAEERLFKMHGVYTPMLSHPTTGEESARLYFVLKDLETILGRYEDDFSLNNDVQVVVCTDRKASARKEQEDGTTAYKANRSPNRFTDLDIRAINNTERVIELTGIPVLGVEGYEADDLIQSIVHQHINNFDQFIIFTPDADLAVLVDGKVTLMRYKGEYAKRHTAGVPNVQLADSHAVVNTSNFSDYFSHEYSKNTPVIIDYNTIALYKSMVGDPADNIKGIPRFGGSAFMKFRNALIATGDWQYALKTNTVEGMTQFLEGVLPKYVPSLISEDAYQHVLESYKLVRPYELPIDIREIMAMTRLNKASRKNIYANTWGIKKI